MIQGAREHLEARVLVLAPLGKDGVLTQSILERAYVTAVRCTDLQRLCAELEAGAGAIVLAEEAVQPMASDRLREWLAGQPPWSDLPVLVLARPGADSAAVAEAMDLLGNVTLLERPMRVAALVSAVRAALRARQRQYQVRKHLAEREDVAAELRANDRRKDEFLAVLAHELRNPLAPIRNSLQMLRVTGQHDANVNRCNEIIERQVNHMVRLVDDLLEVSRITRGKIDLRPEPVDVAAVVRVAVETSRPLIEAAGHELTLDLPADELALDADPVRLAQVLSNLLNNAAKYTEAGGRIRLRAWRDGDRVAVSVKDSGMGIAPDMLPRVFELFAQVDRRTTRSQGGLGIGLTLAKNLVEMHGGTVEARSEGLGRGSEFVVRLPLGSGHASADVGANVDGRAALAPQRILVVDDNRDSAESLGGLLAILGADVRVAYDGPDALEALVTYYPDVIVLDIGMPGMDGYEVARRVRQHAELHGVTLIALSGWGQEEDRRRSRSAGFDYHLIKPVNLDVLQTLLHSVHEQAGTRRDDVSQ